MMIDPAHAELLGRVSQSVMCLTADTFLTADLGIASLILARYHTFVEIYHEIQGSKIAGCRASKKLDIPNEN